MSSHLPIRILGAGPAGLAAAITAARAGRPVEVLERRRDVGRRFHDDFQGLENWSTPDDVLDELAALHIEPTFEHTPVRETVAFDPAGRTHVYRSARPFYYLVRRGPAPGTLDASLKAQALAAGVQIRFGESRPEFAGDGIIAAGPRRADAIVVGYVFQTDAADGAYGAMSDRLAPKGYAYLLVTGGRGTLASCLFAEFQNEHLYLERTAEFFRRQVGVTMRAPRRFGGTANFALPRTARRGSLLLVGEAAGFQDPLWGFGMRYALLSGNLAAGAVVAGRPQDYDRRWKERFGAALATGVVNRFLYARLGERGYRWLLGRLDRAADPRDWLRRIYGPSALKGLLAPLLRRSGRVSYPPPRPFRKDTWTV